MELHLDSFALVPLIDGVIKTIEPLAAKNGNEVEVHCDAAIGTMHADQVRLRQALLNLMSNANKFTNHGTITIDAVQRQQLLGKTGHGLTTSPDRLRRFGPGAEVRWQKSYRLAVATAGAAWLSPI